VGKRGLYWSRNPSAYITNGIIDSPLTSITYIIQKPGDVRLKNYSPEALRVAVASGEVQLDWQARSNGKKITVREALSTCYECGKEIDSLDVVCPSCGAPFRAAQPSLGATTATASSALDFHVARKGKHFGPYTEVAARNYLADGRIKADDLCWRPGMDNWLPASQVLRAGNSGLRESPLAVVSTNIGTRINNTSAPSFTGDEQVLCQSKIQPGNEQPSNRRATLVTFVATVKAVSKKVMTSVGR
jgi:hypothetical protein